uniref:CCHC-type domain-containing protein n=1 Tax=Anopheles dirus TaxID=7168 RepID=A0A182NYP0_9DIPT
KPVRTRACTKVKVGPKCFVCQGYGHKASECARRKNVVPSNINVVEEATVVNNTVVKTLFDSGNKQNLMTKSCHWKIEGSKLSDTSMCFRGFGGLTTKDLGFFTTDVKVANNVFR